jgi:hypothetical protein
MIWQTAYTSLVARVGRTREAVRRNNYGLLNVANTPY